MQGDAPIAQQQPALAVVPTAGPSTAAVGGHAGGPADTIPVSFEVPHCQLAHGDHLRVVGSCPALGAWHVGAAPALEWRAGHRWAATLALPPGRHSFKLVLVRADGSTAWEVGADRALRIPDLAGAPAGAAPLLAVTCARFGGTEQTALRVDGARLQVGPPHSRLASLPSLPPNTHPPTHRAACLCFAEAPKRGGTLCKRACKVDWPPACWLPCPSAPALDPCAEHPRRRPWRRRRLPGLLTWSGARLSWRPSWRAWRPRSCRGGLVLALRTLRAPARRVCCPHGQPCACSL